MSAAHAGSCDITFTGGTTLRNIPTASTPAEQAQGLSHREDITSGMLFVWPDAQLRSFWMKDTLKPISVGFIDENMVLFQIEDMQPMTKNLHFSMKKAKLALELPLGQYAANNIRVGNKTLISCKN